MSVRRRFAVAVLVASVLGAGAGVAAGLPIGSAASTGGAAVRLRPPSDVPEDVDVRAALALVDAVNAARAARGLPALRWSDAASTAARRHAVDMAAARQLRHLGSDGSDGGARLRAAGVTWSTWAEAIAAGVRDAPTLVNAWLASPGHRAVLLGGFTRVGVGVATASDGTPYWTLDAFS